MTPIWGHEDVVVPFVASLVGATRDFGDCRTLAVLHDDRLVAGIVFHNWSPEGEVIEVTAGATHRGWATRTVLREGFGYAFAFCQLAVARTAPGNKAVRRLWSAFGAQEYLIPRLRGRSEAEVIITLTAEAWATSKFARQEHGQTQSADAA